jgi:hypothetical protein
MLTKNQIKLVRSLEQKKNRKRDGLFVAEGPKVVEDLLRGGYRPYAIYSTQPRPDAQLITDEELHKISFLQHPQEVLAIFEMPPSSLPTHQSSLITHQFSLPPHRHGAALESGRLPPARQPHQRHPRRLPPLKCRRLAADASHKAICTFAVCLPLKTLRTIARNP